MSVEVTYPQGNHPTTDEERRKQADARRPMMMRRMLVWDMKEKVDLERAFEQQLARKGRSDAQ